MKTIAIISEYNPFHLGHLHQINTIKEIFKDEELAIISIMSGNFVQRGGPSIIDKFKRCDVALTYGINLCLEIPVHIVLSSAEGFAYGTIKIINKLGFIDYICFGCENPNIEYLDKISERLISLDKSDFRKYSSSGLSFPRIQELIISNFFEDPSLSVFMKSPNNILAIEYLKSIKILNSHIKILPIQRIGNNYNDKLLSNTFSSATSIRNILSDYTNDISILKKHVPKQMYKYLKTEFLNENIVDKELMFKYIKYKIMTTKNLSKIQDTEEGIENRFYSNILKSNTLDQFILNTKSKRYTYSRLNRILTRYFIGFENFDKEYMKNVPEYVRILGFDKIGGSLLNKFKKICTIPLIPKFNKKFLNTVKLDTIASKAYSIINKNFSPISDFKFPPITKL